jgi:hypothetical protein
VCSPDTVVEVSIDASGNFSGSILLTAFGTTVLTFDELQTPSGGFCRLNAVVLARIVRRVTISDVTVTPTPTSTLTPTPNSTLTPTASPTASEIR